MYLQILAFVRPTWHSTYLFVHSECLVFAVPTWIRKTDPQKMIPLHPGPTWMPNVKLDPSFFGRRKNGKIIQKVAIWVFPKIGIPQNGWLIMENPIKMDDLGGKPIIFGNTHLFNMFAFFCTFVISPYLRCNLRKRSTDVLWRFWTSIGLPIKTPLKVSDKTRAWG